MRVISGSKRGMVLETPEGLDTRPTSDRIKETLFNMIAFDIPDRQYSDMKQTIFLCQKMYNNREMIPELFSIPEIYINLNDNDFGKQKEGVRVHNITFKP